MSVQEIFIPDIGDVDEVEVIEVLVQPGAQVAVDDPLLTLESDKASMDVPSPAAGVVRDVKVQVGDKVSQGRLIVLLEAETARDAPTIDNAGAAPAPQTSTASADPAPVSTSAAAPATSVSSEKSAVHASPGVRRLARVESINLADIPGTGSKGRVTKRDIEQFQAAAAKPAKKASADTKTQSTGMGIPPIPSVDFSAFGPVEEAPLSRIKRVSGPHLHRVWLNVPMVTHHDEADITELEAFRKSLKVEAEKAGLRITPLAFIMKSVVSALKVFPDVNSSLGPDRKSLILKRYFNIGIAVDTPNGLVVPVIRDVDQKSIYDLSRDLAEVSTRARDGKLAVKDMEGGCFSISSLGGIGGTAFTPIVNAPEVAILGVSRAYMKPVWIDNQFQPRLTLPLDLTYDHRVVDGALAAHFVVHLCRTLSDTRRLLL